MDWREFPHWGSRAADWAAQYHQTIRERPVRAQVRPSQIAGKIAKHPPEMPEAMAQIMGDFEEIIVPGMTHWQHPRFFAYFPANISPPSMLAEMLTSIMGAQCMLWQTSPAATELEMAMVDWLRQALALPAGYSGVIQDSASSATLAAVLTMRERATGFQGNKQGIAGQAPMRIYCSDQVHSSIDRACWVAGIGQENLVKLPTTGVLDGLDASALKQAISDDRKAGRVPAGVIAVTGGTSTGACDDLELIGSVAAEEGLYSHLDAAWAGAAMICPEFRQRLWPGVEHFDSVIFNPHKWLGAHFDCSVQFLKNPSSQINALKIEPEYLKTQLDEITNFSEWSIPLGRRFRALKLWFLIRAYGLESLRSRLRNHVTWAAELCEKLRASPNFQVVTEPSLSLFSFRCAGGDQAQQQFIERVNDDGRIYLTQAIHRGRKVIRFQVGQFETTWSDILMAYEVLEELATEPPGSVAASRRPG